MGFNFFSLGYSKFSRKFRTNKSLFNERITTYVEHQNEEISLSNVSESITKSKNEVLLIKTLSGRLRILFGFNQQLMIEIKKYLITVGTQKINCGPFHFLKYLKIVLFEKQKN